MIESLSEWKPEELIAFTIDNAPPIKTGLGRFVLKDQSARATGDSDRCVVLTRW